VKGNMKSLGDRSYLQVPYTRKTGQTGLMWVSEIIAIGEIDASHCTALLADATDWLTIDMSADALLEFIAASVPADGGLLGARAKYADGNQVIVLPNWVKLDITTIFGGSAVANEDGDLLFEQTGVFELQWSGLVSHNYGKFLILGSSRNGEEPVEYYRFPINSSSPVFVYGRHPSIAISRGETLAFFLSSDFEYQNLVWSEAEAQLIEEPSR